MLRPIASPLDIFLPASAARTVWLTLTRDNEQTMAICWLNDQFVPEDQAQISIFDRGLLFGDATWRGPSTFFRYIGCSFSIRPKQCAPVLNQR